MLSEYCYQLLNMAAVESLERIQQDRLGAPKRLRPLFDYIEEHLFDPTLNVTRLRRAVGFGDNSLSIQFHSAIGHAPRRYIEDRRLETGRRLLEATDLRVWQIAELLGFSGLAVFSRVFSRRHGDGPSAYRKRASEGSGGGRTGPPLDGGGELADPELWRRAMAGELQPAEACALIEGLRRMYPSSGVEERSG